MKLVEEVGGARVGFKQASWPFARLTVSKKELRLKVKLIGQFRFKPEEIEALEVIKILPVVGKGIRIRHTNPDYPSRLIFWTLSDPKAIAGRIQSRWFRSELAHLCSFFTHKLRCPFLHPTPSFIVS